MGAKVGYCGSAAAMRVHAREICGEMELKGQPVVFR